MASASHLPPARGLTLVSDRPLSALLADAEEPTHLKWNASRPRLNEDYDGAKEAVGLVRQAMPRLLAFLSNSVSKRDTKALSKFFPKAEEAGVSKKNASGADKKGEGENEEKPEGIPLAKPRPFRWEHGDSWDRIVAKETAEISSCLPILARAEFAYEGLGSDPFANYDPFDFDLAPDSGFELDAEGGEILKRDGNVVEFEVTALPFALTIDGFDTKIRRRMRIDYTLSSDGKNYIEE